MRKIIRKSSFLGLTLLIVVTNLYAQDKRYIDAWAGMGYSALWHGIEDSKAPGGFGYQIGAGYEVNRDNLIFITGLEFMHFNSKTTMDSYNRTYTSQYLTGEYGADYFDTYNLDYNYKYNKYEEKYSFGYVNIPLLVGMQNDQFYGLVGLKLGLNLFGSYTLNSTLETTATDPKLIDDLAQMPNHFLASRDYSDDDDLDLGFSLAPTVEFGVILDDFIADLGKRRRRRNSPYSYRLGVFADYGMLNINSASTDKSFIKYAEAPENPLDIETNSLLSTDLADGNAAHNFMIGLKFTLKYDVTPKPKRKPKPKPTPKPAPKPKPVPKPVEIPVFYAHAYDAENNNNLDAEVTISAITNKKEIFRKTADKSSGLVNNALKAGKYSLFASCEGYMNFEEEINFSKGDTVKIAMQVIKKDVAIVLHNLFFELNSAVIMAESEPALVDLYNFLVANPSVKIQIVGHTDDSGEDAYNLNLSKNRANAVSESLIEKGIDAGRLSAIGKGSEEPIATNETEEGRAQNRRVEFIIQ